MYVCSVAVVTPGPWTGSANWTRVTVESVIDNLTASDIHYGVSSNVNTELGNINTALSEKSNLLTTGTYSNTFTVAASADVAVDITITKAGYTPIGIVGYGIGNLYCMPHNMSIIDSNTARFYISNVSTVTQSNRGINVTILFVKN